MFVLDGNMKNNREVCYAVGAGYTEFIGLPGKVKQAAQTLLHSSLDIVQFISLLYVAHCKSDGGDTQVQTISSPFNTPKVAGIITNKCIMRTSVLHEV